MNILSPTILEKKKNIRMKEHEKSQDMKNSHEKRKIKLDKTFIKLLIISGIIISSLKLIGQF